jgi:ADP-ribosylglycohydrolase
MSFFTTETVGRVVYDVNFLSHPSETAYAYWDKNGRSIAPNGSLMRTTPIGIICMKKSEEETFEEAIRMGAVTHADPRCALSVAVVSCLVRALCREEIKHEADINALLERGWTYMGQFHPNLSLDRFEFQKHAFAESLDSLVLCDGGMGYVYKCLGSALWCLRQVFTRQETFKSAMTKLVMCGGDADTNGAVAGALMGALYGYNLLPREWKEGLKYKEWYNWRGCRMFSGRSSVATAIADVFRNNGISMGRNLAKILKIFEKIDEAKSRGVI